MRVDVLIDRVMAEVRSGGVDEDGVRVFLSELLYEVD